MNNISESMEFKPITEIDLDEIGKLQPIDWPDIVPDISFYINSSFCHPIMALVNNAIVGTGTLIIFENSCWLAHIIVGSHHRNKGIGSAIVNELLKTVAGNSITICSLIATELGKPVYEKAGYRTVAHYSMLERKEPWADLTPISRHIIPFEEKYRPMIYALDKQVSGESREPLLDEFLPNAMLYVENNQALGFYMPGLKEGLIFAHTSEAGLALMKLKYSIVSKAALPTENSAGIDFLLQHGFREIKTLTRMVLGNEPDWQPSKIFSRIGGNFG
jgi:hypothetical protein